MKQLNTFMMAPLLLVSATSYAGLFGSDTTIKIGHYFAESHPQHIALQEFEKAVEEKSNGEIDVKIFPNAQLGSEEQLINGMRNGTIEMALFGSLMQNLDPKLGFTETPFLIRDYDHARKVLDSDVGEEIAGVFEEHGVKHLAYSVSGFRVISSNKKIEKPEDYNGLRIRVPNVAMFLEMADLLGVNGQAMAFTEVFTALEQGVVDAQENPMSLIKAQGFYEVQKYIIETNHMFTSLNLGINKSFYDDLTQEQQQIISEAAEQYSINSWSAVVKDNSQTKAFFVEQGVQVLTPSDELAQWNQEAMKPLYQNMFKRHAWAEDMTNRIIAQ